MMKRVSSTEVARRAGVSQTTVSHVMNERYDISIPDATRERVMQAARELRYRPNNLARSLVKGQTLTIGLLLPYLGSDFHADIIRGIRAELARDGYRLLIADTEHRPELEASQADFLLDHRVDGLLWISGPCTLREMPRWLADISTEKVPCVIVDDRTFGDRIDCVVSDDHAGMEITVDHLAKRGHSRILHLRTSDQLTSFNDRKDGFLAAVGKRGLTAEFADVVAEREGLVGLSDCLSPILARADRPTAIVADNDYGLEGARDFAASLGLRVPNDLALVGYGDQVAARLLNLTSVSQGATNMGREGATRLLSRLREPAQESQTIYTPVSLVERSST